MSAGRETGPAWLKLAGLGFELVAAVAGFSLVGYWIDRHYGSAPWGVVIGASLGILGGMYNLIRVSLAAASGPGSGKRQSGNDES